MVTFSKVKFRMYDIGDCCLRITSMLSYFRFLNVRNFTISDFILIVRCVFFLFSNKPLKIFNNFLKYFQLWLCGLVLIILGLGLSTLINEGHDRFFHVIPQLIFVYLFVPFVLLHVNKDALEKILKYNLYGITIVSLAGFIMYSMEGNFNQFTIGGRMGLFLQNPNALAKSISIVLPICFFLYNK
jgi:hypothetical protein